MDLYCIKTHSKKVVIAGNIYPFIGRKTTCKCKDLIDVGIPSSMMGRLNGRRVHCPMGALITCHGCGYPYPQDGIWWLKNYLFAIIDDASIEEIEEILQEDLITI